MESEARLGAGASKPGSEGQSPPGAAEPADLLTADFQRRTPGKAAAVVLRGISKAYGRSLALAGVDLLVPEGTSVLVWGSNGAGKSTLLRIVATAISPTYGEGEVMGGDLRLNRAKIRAVTELLGHRTRLYEDLTPLEYLDFVKALWDCRGGTPSDALDRVGLWEFRKKRIREFSQGMRQRVALARVYLRRPGLLLLDEPYSGLDAPARMLVDELCFEMRHQSATVLIATHDVERVISTVDFRLHLEAGRAQPDSHLAAP